MDKELVEILLALTRNLRDVAVDSERTDLGELYEIEKKLEAKLVMVTSATVLYDGNVSNPEPPHNASSWGFGGSWKIEIVKAIRVAANLSLKESKDLVDRASIATPARIVCTSPEAAGALLKAIARAGGTARLDGGV